MEGSRPWERGSMTDGKLGVYVLRDQSRFALARILLNVLLGRFRGVEEFEVICTPEIAIRAHRRKIRVSLDGEIFRLKSPIVFRSLQRALRVMVPANGKRAREFFCVIERGTPSAF
jgi:diacylglycerol kinase family enzyme